MDVTSPDVWRGLADQAHKVALTIHDPGLRAEMFEIASRYWRMAQHAETLGPRYPVPANTNGMDKAR